jgi:hypothetical protein
MPNRRLSTSLSLKWDCHIGDLRVRVRVVLALKDGLHRVLWDLLRVRWLARKRVVTGKLEVVWIDRLVDVLGYLGLATPLSAERSLFPRF